MEQVESTEAITFGVNFVGFNIKTFFSIQHIKSADLFASKAQEIQDSILNGTSQDYSLLTTYVVASIMSSIAFLEATANEFFAEMNEENSNMVPQVDNSRIVLKKILETSYDKKSVLEKFELLSGFYDITFNKGESIIQDVSFVIKLRNGFTHYQASWLDLATEGMPNRSGSIYQSNLASKIANFRVDGFTHNDNKHWINANCAKFAVESVVAFNDEFFNKIGKNSFINHIKSELLLGE